MILLICTYSIAVIVQIAYWLFFTWEFKKLSNRNSTAKVKATDVSVVICLKDESVNLRKNFPLWAANLAGSDELILVDDFSTDDSAALALELSQQMVNCRVVSCTNDRPGKKQALSDGIAAATNEFILVTDADCAPGSNWKFRMASIIQPSTDFVLGFGPFHRRKGFLNRFQRFEGLLTAIQYFSYASAGRPYMGVGRNMLFRKQVFSPDIYESDLASGDDDLLVSALATKVNTKICIEPETFVYSESPTTMQKYWKQKIRHISSSTEYKWYIKILLSLFSSTQILTYILAIPIMFTCCWHLAIGLLVIRFIPIFLCLKTSGEILDEKDLFIFTPLLDLSLCLYYLILAFSFPFKKKTTWN